MSLGLRPAIPTEAVVPQSPVRTTALAAALTAAVAVPVPAAAAPAAPATTTAAPAAAPPGVPDTATARELLAGLTVAAEGPSDGYSREKFPHWSTVEGACNTRETVLERDGTGVVTDDSCKATEGTWASPFDGATWTDPADVDIDHLVPLAEAWRSGAAAWTTGEREAFANDLTRPQLIAVTDDVNQDKGDQDPAEWQPPLTGYRCTYAKMWIAVKGHWELTLQDAEKQALTAALDACA